MPAKYSKAYPFDDAAMAKMVEEFERKKAVTPPRRDRRWRDFFELASWISNRAMAGKNVVLSPDTAAVIAFQLSIIDRKPTRDEVAMMICRRASGDLCDSPCFECAGRANTVVRAYGFRPDERHYSELQEKK